MSSMRFLAAGCLALILAYPVQGEQSSVTVKSPDGKLVVVADGKTINILDAATQKPLISIRGHTGAVWALAMSPDGKVLASGSQDKTVRLWELATGKELRSFQGHKAGVNAVAFSSDGKTLATRDTDKNELVWDVATGKLLKSGN